MAFCKMTLSQGFTIARVNLYQKMGREKKNKKEKQEKKTVKNKYQSVWVTEFGQQ